MAAPSFDHCTVLTLESRRAKEMATLVTTYGGTAMMAPALREVPLDSNTAALDFARALDRGEFNVVILLTGVGTRTLVEVVEPLLSRERFAAALSRVRVAARGPKPMAVLRELGVGAWVVAPEPNTWRELLMALDAKSQEQPLRDARVAVQEYGVSNPELLAGLLERGARVTRVPVYRWALPEDLAPLRTAVGDICAGRVDVMMLTTGVQLAHLWQVAGEMGQQEQLRDGLRRTVIASIGPTTTEELRRLGLTPDLEASHPKMGILVREAAERSSELLQVKRHPA